MAQQFSISIHWKDNDNNVLICNMPCYNTSCLCLIIIAKGSIIYICQNLFMLLENELIDPDGI